MTFDEFWEQQQKPALQENAARNGTADSLRLLDGILKAGAQFAWASQQELINRLEAEVRSLRGEVETPAWPPPLPSRPGGGTEHPGRNDRWRATT